MESNSRPEQKVPAPGCGSPWVLVFTIAACCAPVVVAAVALGAKGWTPVGEFAQAELRIRDFWDHPPTLGAVARLRTDTDVSSHPGPGIWWLAYPFYAIGGRGAVALSSAVAASACVWMAAALSVAWRRAGDALTVLLGASLILLIAGVGPSVFLEPWNPWFALMAFVALIISVWAVTNGSRWALVLCAAAGTYCIQAHLGYAPLVALLAVVAVFGLWQSGPRADGKWRPLLWPVATSGAVAALMWLPPLLEQLSGDPGNIGLMLSAYRAEAGAESELGVLGALKLVTAYLDPRTPALLLEDSVPAERGPSIATILFGTTWVVAAAMGLGQRHIPEIRSALRLQAVSAVSLIAALFTASRIPGEVFGYLVLWLAAIVSVVLCSIAWTFWLLLAPLLGRSGGSPLRFADPGTRRAVALVLLASASAGVAVSFSDPDRPGAELSETAQELVSQTQAALEPDDPVMLRWDDPAAFGALGTAVLSELERSGVPVGVDERLSTEMRPHRVLSESEADTALWVVSGDAIGQWRELDDVEELAFADPRTPSARPRQVALRARITEALREAGVPELAQELSTNAWAVRSDPAVGPDIDLLIDQYVELGFPTAVFSTSVRTQQPPAD